MHDRLAFDVVTLPNGITVYAKSWDVPFTYAKIVLPVGHMHNTGSMLPGSAHFLEHMVHKRSQLFPEPDSFDKLVSLKGGDMNASTSDTQTEYWISIAADLFPDMFRGFVSQIFQSLIEDVFLKQEVTIIQNERRRRNGRWYPGDNKLEHHCMRQWKYCQPLTICQRFGDDEDLAAMRSDDLLALHRAYLDPRMRVFVGGSYDLASVCTMLSTLQTSLHELPTIYDPLRWEQRTYHEVPCMTSDRAMYHLGGFLESRDPLVHVGMMFLGGLLVNTAHGVLYDWLRRDRTWTYNMGFSMRRRGTPFPSDWELWLPFTHAEQARQVRGELRARIEAGISDQARLNVEYERRREKQVFEYQTLGSVLDAAQAMRNLFGRVVTERELTELLWEVAQTPFLQRLYEEYWSPDVTGEFLALPDV